MAEIVLIVIKVSIQQLYQALIPGFIVLQTDICDIVIVIEVPDGTGKGVGQPWLTQGDGDMLYFLFFCSAHFDVFDRYALPFDGCLDIQDISPRQIGVELDCTDFLLLFVVF